MKTTQPFTYEKRDTITKLLFKVESWKLPYQDELN